MTCPVRIHNHTMCWPLTFTSIKSLWDDLLPKNVAKFVTLRYIYKKKIIVKPHLGAWSSYTASNVGRDSNLDLDPVIHSPGLQRRTGIIKASDKSPGQRCRCGDSKASLSGGTCHGSCSKNSRIHVSFHLQSLQKRRDRDIKKAKNQGRRGREHLIFCQCRLHDRKTTVGNIWAWTPGERPDCLLGR